MKNHLHLHSKYDRKMFNRSTLIHENRKNVTKESKKHQHFKKGGTHYLKSGRDIIRREAVKLAETGSCYSGFSLSATSNLSCNTGVHSSHGHMSAATVFVCVASIRSSICFFFFSLPSTSSIFSHHWIAWLLHLLLLSPPPPPSLTESIAPLFLPPPWAPYFAPTTRPEIHPDRLMCDLSTHPPQLFPLPQSIRDPAAALPTGWAGRRPLAPATSRSCSGSPRAAPHAGPARSAGSCPRV